MRGFLKVTMMAALAVFVGFGCGGRNKINLAGLSENAAGSIGEDGKGIGGNGIGAENGMEPLGLAGLNGAGIDGANGANGGAGAFDPNAPAGGWTDTRDGISGGMLNGQPFVRNGNYWSDKVYFDFNRYEVRPSERAKLDALAEHLRANPNFRVVIEGHTDDRGSDEYNRALAERRSLSVQTYLVSLGIEESRMQTVSYGEDRPAVANARSEAEHQMNRRAEFLIGLP